MAEAENMDYYQQPDQEEEVVVASDQTTTTTEPPSASASTSKAVEEEHPADIDEEVMEDDTDNVVEDSTEDKDKDPLDTETAEEHVESPSTAETYTFKCVFCEQTLSANDDPKLLECLHNACGNCISNKMYENHDNGEDRSQFKCPLCNIACEASKIIDNQFLLELSSGDDSSSMKQAEQKCSSCSDDAIATSWCIDCSEYICDNCVSAHQRLKITKDHTIKPKEEGAEHQSLSSNSTNTLFCSIHPHEKLSLFCQTCDKLTCRDCQLIEHREHKYKFTNEIAADTRKYITEMLKDVGYKRALLTSAMKVIDDRQNLISEKKQALVKEITQLVVKLTNTIKERGKQLLGKLSEVCDCKQKTLHEKKLALEQLSQMTDHCISFTQHALDNGSDMALLYSKKQLTEHLRTIKCKRADIPNPEIPVRIHLALDKFPEIVKVMSTIGSIVVDGRIYPSQSPSPSPSINSSHGSPSPVHLHNVNSGTNDNNNRPVQQASPVIRPIHTQNFQQQQQQHHQQQQHNIQQQQQQHQQQHQQHHQQQPQHQQPLLQQQLQPPPYNVQQHPSRMPPPYNQYTSNANNQQQHQQQQQFQQQQQQQQHQNHNNVQPNNNSGQPQQQQQQSPQQQPPQQQQQQNMGPKVMQAMGPPNIISQQIQLAQQLSGITRMQRPMQITRPLMPRLVNNSGGHNQQQVSSSTHPQGMFQDRSNLRGLLQPAAAGTSNPVYIQTGPSQYQAVQPHVAQQFQTRFPGPQQQQQLQGPSPQQQQQQQHNMQPQQQQQVMQQQYRQQAPMRMMIPGGGGGQMGQQHRMAVAAAAANQRQFVATVQGGTARWHIPQQGGGGGIVNIGGGSGGGPSNNNRNMILPTINDNFKITLKPQHQNDPRSNLPAAVTSTIPKTPSPNHVQGGRSDTERSLDKFCEESVNDLMATIAKLDSNGVQVVAEGRQKQGGSPHVDSSTGDGGPPLASAPHHHHHASSHSLSHHNHHHGNHHQQHSLMSGGGSAGGIGGAKIKPDPMETIIGGKDDPNEDWCAVCMDGGELVCCDKCPKVFHQYCHIPNLSVEENDTWQCLLCTNFADFPEHILNDRKDGEMSFKYRKIAERVVLELYCQYDPSLPFREVIGRENEEYHSIIKNPIALDSIRQKLNWDAPDHYTSIDQLIKDIRLMFKNAYTYNPEDSQVYMDAKTLEKFFDEQLEKFLPEYAYETFEDDDMHPPPPPLKKFKRIISD